MANRSPVPGKEWTWNHTSYSHDGVHTYDGELVWYTHMNDPLAGGGAASQSFDDFLANGPRFHPPPEVVAAFRRLVE